MFFKCKINFIFFFFRKFVLGLKHGITNLDKPPAYLVKTAVVYIEGS